MGWDQAIKIPILNFQFGSCEFELMPFWTSALWKLMEMYSNSIQILLWQWQIISGIFYGIVFPRLISLPCCLLHHLLTKIPTISLPLYIHGGNIFFFFFPFEFQRFFIKFVTICTTVTVSSAAEQSNYSNFYFSLQIFFIKNNLI